jgi:calcineurin-like phosphoesterase family protein
MKTFYTSDTHFNHANIIKYSDRPFPGGVRDMNECMIERWNSVVGKDDIVYHIGDFAMGNKDLAPEIVRRLNGYKVIIAGNHDPSHSKLLSWGFKEVHKQLDLMDGGVKLFLRHAPPKEAYTGDHTGKTAQHFGYEADYFLHGHVHELWKRRGPFINVGVDVRDFYPRTLDELLAE